MFGGEDCEEFISAIAAGSQIRTAVIENESGEVNIDDQLVEQKVEGQAKSTLEGRTAVQCFYCPHDQSYNIGPGYTSYSLPFIAELW